MSEDGNIVRPVVTDEMRNQIMALRNSYKNKKKFIAELKANVDAPLRGTIDEWPSNIQDGVYKALEDTGKSQYIIQMSYCDHTPEDGWFIHVIATAVVPVQ